MPHLRCEIINACLVRLGRLRGRRLLLQSRNVMGHRVNEFLSCNTRSMMFNFLN